MTLNIQLFNADCLDILPTLEKGSVDMVLTDLPYGTTACKWDTIIDLKKMWKYLDRICLDTTPIILFSQIPFSITLGMSNIENLRYEWIWVKEQGSGFLQSKKAPMKIHENILVFYKKLPYYNPIMRGEEIRKVKRGNVKPSAVYGDTPPVENSIYKGRFPIDVLKFNRDKHMHPTQKPVKLLQYLIQTYTKKGDTVLDFTMGSGSTGVASKSLKRKFIGIELDPKYYDIACKRIYGIKIKKN